MSSFSPDKKIKLETSWLEALDLEFSKPYMASLREYLRQELQQKKIIYPKPAEYFAALDATPVERVKVVILGQDPYHGPSQAHGLCFSVRPSVPPPPSLVNIFKELESDLKIKRPDHGCLLPWARQGVLLLNATLSVEAELAGSHQKKGWEEFTDAIVRYLNDERDRLVFFLWGNYAQKKGEWIDRKKHLVLEAPHPSPLSAHRGFLGCKHFSQANAYLIKQGKKAVDWSLPSRSELKGQL